MDINDKKAHILKVAESLFAQNGFDATSIRAIAKEADVNIAMISYYFGSKEKLLEHLIDDQTADFTYELESILKTDDSHLVKLEKIVEKVIRKVHQRRKIHKIIHFEYAKSNRQLTFESYLKNKRINFHLIENFIREGQQAKVFSKEVTIPLLLPTVLGTYFNFLYNKKSYEDIYQLDPSISVDEFVHGTLTKHITRTLKALLTYEEN